MMFASVSACLAIWASGSLGRVPANGRILLVHPRVRLKRARRPISGRASSIPRSWARERAKRSISSLGRLEEPFAAEAGRELQGATGGANQL